VRTGGLAGNAVRFQTIEANGVVRAVGFAKAVGEVDERAIVIGGFQLVGEHAFPLHLTHIETPLEKSSA
jgi:hypothetical protein